VQALLAFKERILGLDIFKPTLSDIVIASRIPTSAYFLDQRQLRFGCVDLVSGATVGAL
jgi:hypothetical protein